MGLRGPNPLECWSGRAHRWQGTRAHATAVRAPVPAHAAPDGDPELFSQSPSHCDGRGVQGGVKTEVDGS